MSNTKFSNFKSEDGSTGPDLVGITTFTSPYYFVPPSGTTAQRPSNAVPGQLRFNTDIGRLEVWRGDHWATILGESPNLNGGARGVFAGGRDFPAGINPAGTNIIDYVTLSSLGNAIDFGDLTFVAGSVGQGGAASISRGIFASGYDSGGNDRNDIQYVTISSTGNAFDFGDLTTTRRGASVTSNSTRGVAAAGSGPSNVIDYFTIASTGNAQDFGDTIVSTDFRGGCSSSTRSVFAGGYVAPAFVNSIDYITTSTTGNAQDFADLTAVRGTGLGTFANSTRGIFGGGNLGGGATSNVIDFITIATLGNASDFGDLSAGKYNIASCSSSTRGLFAGGNPTTNTIEYITILTTGNAQDFGDLTNSRNASGALSNAHGGL